MNRPTYKLSPFLSRPSLRCSFAFILGWPVALQPRRAWLIYRRFDLKEIGKPA
jgi:hypothetical protein